MKMRLLEDHPAVKALEEVFNLMKAHEINLTVLPYGKIMVSHGGKDYMMVDNENGNDVYQFPPVFEYKLTYEKEG